MNERVQGHIKWFSHQKRYGFIRREDGLPDVFLHVNEFRSRTDAHWVNEGDPVEFALCHARLRGLLTPYYLAGHCLAIAHSPRSRGRPVQ